METLPGPSVDDPAASSKNTALDTSKSSTVLTMEPYSYSSPASNNSRRFRFRRLGNNFDAGHLETTPGNYEPNNYSRFLVLKMKNGQRMRDFDMFALNREIVACCQNEPKISYLNDGSLLVEVSSIEDSSKLLSIPSLSGSNVESVPHRSLNQSRGVIRSVELLRYSEEKLQEEFEDQGVVNVKQMKKTVSGLLTPLPTYVLTFNSVKLPRFIRAAWLRLEVRPYIPSCRRCFYCQRYGHVINSCRKKIKGEKGVCAQCGQDEHGECNNPPHCINCGESHPASSKKCTRFIFEQEVQALRAKEHLSFQEARQRVGSVFINSGKTFSSLFKDTTSSNISKPANSSYSDDKPKHSPLNKNQTNSQDVAKNRPSNAKRRLSGEREENPSSRVHLANSFDLLTDEMDAENTKFALGPPMDQVGSPVPAVSLVQPGTLVSASAIEQAGTSSSACDADQAGISFSACDADQAVNSVSACPLERADSFVSASSGQELLPSLENESLIRDKNKITGAKPKNSPNISEQRKSPEISNRTLKVPNKIPKEANRVPRETNKVPKEPNRVPKNMDNKNKKKEVIVIGKT